MVTKDEAKEIRDTIVLNGSPVFTKDFAVNFLGISEEVYEIKFGKAYSSSTPLEYNQDLRKIKGEYLDLIHQKRWGDASELLVKWILKHNNIYTTKDDLKSEVWIYRKGIYTPNGKSEIKEMLRELLGEWYSTFTFNNVMEKISPDTFIDIDKFFQQNYEDEIPVLNGILNIKTRELSSFTPDKIFFNKLPVIYNPDASCEQIEAFLSEVLSKEDDKKVFYEMGGFCLLNDYKFEKAFMFVGSGRNGKDKSLELIKRLFGIENCCSIPLASIVPDSFIISEFYNKKVNLSGEISNHDLKDTSMFKSLTGRSLQSAPRKFLRPITFINHAKFIFACNELPMVYDNTRGFWDRWVLLEFPYTFLPQEDIDKEEDKTSFKLRDENIIDKITTKEELSGLLNKFLNGLDRLMKNKRFSSTQGSEEIKQLWIRKSNSCMAFCLSEVEESYDSYISKKDFRKKYSLFCKKHKISAKSDYVIKRTIEELYGATEENKDIFGKFEKVWGGIRCKN